MRGDGAPNSRSIARSISRWPPYAAGSISRGRPSRPRARCRSTGRRAGARAARAGRPAPAAARSRARSRPRRRPAARRGRRPRAAAARAGARRRTPGQSSPVAGGSSTAPSRSPPYGAPGGGAPNAGAPAAWTRARPRPELLLAGRVEPALVDPREREERRRPRREHLRHGEPAVDLAEPAQPGGLRRVLAGPRAGARLDERRASRRRARPARRR